ncbi:hypothetical protein J4727_07345 [Providencia rettgeri]|uniref:Uncharacterized protein n=1 Tax=Providencia rettgeri TaxID=587 RepID=A0A939SR84_PRORE|nr:hypothetical protein [Providencia rettgeri]
MSQPFRRAGHEAVMDSIMDDRWKGLRNPDRVMEQRDMIAMRDRKSGATPASSPIDKYG